MLDIQKNLWYCVVLERSVILWQNADQTATDLSVSATTDAGRDELSVVIKKHRHFLANPFAVMVVSEKPVLECTGLIYVSR